ncbi:MAG: hypothetical protein ACLP7O_07325 [Terracidiphilus sp.]
MRRILRSALLLALAAIPGNAQQATPPADTAQPAAQSLLKSHYKPGSVNGKAVPMQVSIHLEHAGFPPTK